MFDLIGGKDFWSGAPRLCVLKCEKLFAGCWLVTTQHDIFFEIRKSRAPKVKLKRSAQIVILGGNSHPKDTVWSVKYDDLARIQYSPHFARFCFPIVTCVCHR